MGDTLEKISDQLDRVESALIGDKRYGSIGLVCRVEKLEEKTVSRATVIKWGLAGLGSVILAVAAIIEKIIN